MTYAFKELNQIVMRDDGSIDIFFTPPQPIHYISCSLAFDYMTREQRLTNRRHEDKEKYSVWNRFSKLIKFGEKF